MRTEPLVPARWVMTIGLLVLGAIAGAMAPRLAAPEPPKPEPVAEAATDFCLSVGQFECCYKEPKQP